MALALHALILGAGWAARGCRRRARQHQHHKHKDEFHGHFSLCTRLRAVRVRGGRSNKEHARRNIDPLVLLVDQNASPVLSPN
jgi:hypothetical protein